MGSAGIIGGQDATGTEDFSKTVVAFYNVAEGSLCTASILSDSVLVTAAHCVSGNATDIVAVFNTDLKGSNLIVRRVMQTKTSDLWAANQDQDTNEGDIALAQFAGGLPDGFKPATLLDSVSQLADGQDVLLAGYGITNGVSHAGAGLLRSVVTQIKQVAYSETEVLMNQTAGKGACHGDSGGPAYAMVNGSPRLFGVTSRGVDDAANDCTHFAAYTDILPYLDWVKKTMGDFKAAPPAAPPVAIAPPAKPAAPARKRVAIAV